MIEICELDNGYFLMANPAFSLADANKIVTYGFLYAAVGLIYPDYKRALESYNGKINDGFAPSTFDKLEDAKSFVEEWLIPRLLLSQLNGRII